MMPLDSLQRAPFFSFLFVAASFSLLAAGCSRKTPPATSSIPGKVDFTLHVRPILQTHCLPCHNTGLLLGLLNLENRELAFSSSFIVPGQPDASKLYTVTLLTEGVHVQAMPPEGPRMTKEDKEVLRRWIQQGAQWPEGPEGTLRPLDPEPGATG